MIDKGNITLSISEHSTNLVHLSKPYIWVEGVFRIRIVGIALSDPHGVKIGH